MHVITPYSVDLACEYPLDATLRSIVRTECFIRMNRVRNQSEIFSRAGRFRFVVTMENAPDVAALDCAAHLSVPTIDTDAVMAAAAAADAVLCEPADEPASAADGQAHAP